MKKMINPKTLALLLMLMAMLGTCFAYEPDYAQDVAITSNPSPRDRVSGSSINQFGRGQTNSQIDNYINQDEQINLDRDSGLVRVLRTNQKAVVNNFVTAVIPIKNTNPRELRGLARTITRKEGGDADVLRDQVTGEMFMVVVCPDFQVPFIQKAFAKLDQEWVMEVNNGSWFTYYKGQHRNVRNIMQVLQLYRSPDGIWDFDDANNALIFLDQPNVEPLFRWGTETVDIRPSQLVLDVAIYEVNTQNDLALGLDWLSWKNTVGRDMFEFLFWNFQGDNPDALFPGSGPAGLSDWGRFRGYNFLLTTAYVDFLQSKGAAQLVTKATISAKSGTMAELAALDAFAAIQSITDTSPQTLQVNRPLFLGDLYAFYFARGKVSLSLQDVAAMPASEAISHLDTFLSDVAGAGASLRGVVLSDLHQAAANGAISVADMAGIRLGTDIVLPVFRERTLQYVEAGQTGILLSILPVVGLESAELSIALDVTDVVGFTPTGSPMIESRHLASVVEVADGQPLVLAGLKRNDEVKTASGIPFLRDLPWLGYLFGREVTTKRDKELVVFVTPRFDICATTTEPLHAEHVTAMQVASGQAVLEVPATRYGFDQWLFDQKSPNSAIQSHATGIID